MSDSSRVWTPTMGSRLAVLRSELTKPDVDRVEIAIADTPIQCHVGMDAEGSMWVRITCEPASVSVDDRSAAVQFVITTSGYRVTVAATTVESVSIRFLDEVLQLLSDGHAPGDAGRAALQNWRGLLAGPAGAPLSESA